MLPHSPPTAYNICDYIARLRCLGIDQPLVGKMQGSTKPGPAFVEIRDVDWAYLLRDTIFRGAKLIGRSTMESVGTSKYA